MELTIRRDRRCIIHMVTIMVMRITGTIMVTTVTTGTTIIMEDRCIIGELKA